MLILLCCIFCRNKNGGGKQTFKVFIYLIITLYHYFYLLLFLGTIPVSLSYGMSNFVSLNLSNNDFSGVCYSNINIFGIYYFWILFFIFYVYKFHIFYTLYRISYISPFLVGTIEQMARSSLRSLDLHNNNFTGNMFVIIVI